MSQISTRAYLTTMADGSIVAVNTAGAISVFSLENGETLVESTSGNRKVLVEKDATIAKAMFDTIGTSLKRHPSNGRTIDRLSRLYPMTAENRQTIKIVTAIALLLIAFFTGLIWGMNIRPLPEAWAPSMRTIPTVPPMATPPVVQAPVVVPPRAGTPEPVLDVPVPPRTVEEINADKGPQLPPPSDVPPPQPAIDLPTGMSVEPLEAPTTPLAPPAETPADQAPAADQAAPATPEAPAPAAETPAPAATGDVSTIENPLGDRVEATQQTAIANQDAARADVATAGPELATAQLASMKQALDMLQSGQKLPADFIAQLPPEVAATLEARGVVMTPEESALANAAATNTPPISIIKIPAPIVDQHRDADGVPDIPESNSWSVFGAGIPLPLPGGGEIQRPEDFARFGLEQ